MLAPEVPTAGVGAIVTASVVLGSGPRPTVEVLGREAPGSMPFPGECSASGCFDRNFSPPFHHRRMLETQQLLVFSS